MRRFALFFIASFLLVIPAQAQDGYPLPPNLLTITPENSAQLTELASIGGMLPGGLAWSQDGVHLAVGTSAGIHVFDLDKLDAAPTFIPVSNVFQGLYFDPQGNLTTNGRQKWNIHTGKAIPLEQTAVPLAQTLHYLSPDGSIEAIPDFKNGHVIIHLVDPRMTPSKTLADLDTGLDADFRGVVFSPDGQKLAVQTNMNNPDYDNYPSPAVQLWDVPSRKLLNKWQIGYGEIDVMDFSDDSRLFIAVEIDPQYEGLINYGDMQIWDTKTGEMVTDKMISSPSDYATAPNGRLAVRNYDDIGLWTGQDYIHLPGSECYAESGNGSLLEFSPSGDVLATGIECGEQIQLWDTTEQIDPTKSSVVLDSENRITNVAFSPDEMRVLTNEAYGVAQVWDARTGAHILDVEGEAVDVKFSVDGGMLFGSDIQRNHILWDASTGKHIITLPLFAVLNVDWSQIAYWVDNAVVRVTETRSGKSIDLNIIDDYMGMIDTFSAQAGKVIFTSDDVHGYDLETGDVFFRQPIVERKPWAQFNAYGSYFFTAISPTVYGRGDPLIIDIWDGANLDRPVTTIKIPDGNGHILLSPDGKLLSELDGACGDGGGGSYRLWDAATGELLVRLYPSGQCGPYAHTFSPDMKWVIVGWDYNVDIVNIADAVQEAATDEYRFLSSAFTSLYSNQRYTNMTALQVSPNGERLAVSMTFRDWENSDQYDSPIVTYRISIFNLPKFIDESGSYDMYKEPHVDIEGVQKAVFSPNGDYLMTENGLYDAETGDLLASVASATSAFSPDGKVLATAGTDGVQLFDVAVLAKGEATPLATFPVQSVQEVAFNPDGKTVYIRGMSDMQVWGIPPAS